MFRAWSTDGICVSELVNRVVVTYVILIVLGYLLSSLTHISVLPFAAGIVATAILIPTFVALSKIKNEGFAATQITRNATGPTDVSGEGFINQTQKPTYSGPPGNPDTLPMVQSQTQANVRNPFHNITIDEYAYSPTRASAPDITTPDAKVALDSMFRTQWYSDPTDVFGKTQSQRMFVTSPVTTVPNDQDSYQKWLYKLPGKTCKEGNQEACYGGSQGAVMPWLNL
jgi:hypothetical protein